MKGEEEKKVRGEEKKKLCRVILCVLVLPWETFWPHPTHDDFPRLDFATPIPYTPTQYRGIEYRGLVFVSTHLKSIWLSLPL